MNENHEDTIIEMVNQSGQAVMVGDSIRAEEWLTRARQLDPVTCEIELARRAWANQSGSTAEIKRRRDSVVARLGGVAVAAPDRIDTWRVLADYLRQLANHEGVLRATASGLKRDPTNIELWVRRTRAQIELGQLDSAARSLRHCTRLAPTHDAVEALIRVHPMCANCGALFDTAGADCCKMCGHDGPGRGAVVRSVRARNSSKFDVYFPRVRDVIADSLNMPDRIKKQLTLDTLLKRHLKRTNQQCASVLRALSKEFGAAFDEPLFHSAVVGFLDLLIADLIRAINPKKDTSIDTGIRQRALADHITRS
ncbi:MAG: hypothetical protein H6841_10845 [Planctomycetes bacterium]|nr:hypothetical protein [Planctomycetota bacterium]MCB9936262.1 hypothetical protein [Planctomycetota bacterium]